MLMVASNLLGVDFVWQPGIVQYNRVPALIGCGKGGNVTSAGWPVTLRDPIWHVSSRSGEACCELLDPVTLLYFTW